MEKFTNWRDKATGISPFIPTSNTKTNYVAFLWKIPVSIVKFPIYLVLTLLIILLSPIPFLQTPFIRLYLLLVCNLASIPSQKISLKDQDLVITNFTSFVDPLILKFLYANSVFLVNDTKNQVRQVSLSESVAKALVGPNDLGELVTDMSKFRGKLIWYFPEGTTSNNKSILKFEIPSIIGESSRNLRTLTTIKSNWIITVLPVSLWQVVWLQISSVSNLKLSLKLSTSNLQIKDVKQSLQANRLKTVNLDLNDKSEFIKAYEKRNKY